VWAEVREIQRADSLGRDVGVVVDPRSDSLETLRSVLEDQVLPDLDGAVKDCILGVVSLVLLTLPLVDSGRGPERARELLGVADRLFFQSIDLLEGADWPVDPDKYHVYRPLLGGEPTDCAGSPLRVFVYNSTWDLSRHTLRTAFGMMGAGAHVHAYLRRSSCLTDDPARADLFFIPAHHGEQYDEMLERRIHEAGVEEHFPHLARRRGADHFFVVAANLPSWVHLEPLRHSMLLTVESYQVNNDVPRWYSPWKDVMIPGYIDRWRIAAMRSVNKPTEERGFILVFHGNHPGTHHLYQKFNARVRTRILEAFSGLPDCSVGGHTQDFFERMGRSHFCLVPRGSSAWTIHLYESFFFGCIPVILSDELEVPFQEVVDWPSLSLKWPEDRVGPELLDHLRAMPLARVAEMKRNLEAAACWFDFHRGWGAAPGPDGWVLRSQAAAALSGDCPYAAHGDAASADACRASCERDASCNLVNYLPPKEGQPVGGDCVLRACRDPAQPTLTDAAMGYEVWAKVDAGAHGCSPFAAMFRSLEQRVRRRPFTHGPHWGVPGSGGAPGM